MQWLRLRGEAHPKIHGIAAHRPPNAGMTRAWQVRVPLDTDRVIMDTPAAISGHALADLVAQADTVLVPVLPSPIDIHAATRFIGDLWLIVRKRPEHRRVAVIANRVHEKTLMYHELSQFLTRLEIPFVTSLRDTQNYAKAAQRGLGIHELESVSVQRDIEQWAPVLRWLENGSDFSNTLGAKRALEPRP